MQLSFVTLLVFPFADNSKQTKVSVTHFTGILLCSCWTWMLWNIVHRCLSYGRQAFRQQSQLLSRKRRLRVKSKLAALAFRFISAYWLNTVPCPVLPLILEIILSQQAQLSLHNTVWTKFVSCAVSSIKFHLTCPSTCLRLIFCSHSSRPLRGAQWGF